MVSPVQHRVPRSGRPQLHHGQRREGSLQAAHADLWQRWRGRLHRATLAPGLRLQRLPGREVLCWHEVSAPPRFATVLCKRAPSILLAFFGSPLPPSATCAI